MKDISCRAHNVHRGVQRIMNNQKKICLMKLVALSLSLCLLSIGVLAQGDPPENHPNEFGVNVTPLLTQVFNVVDGIIDSNQPMALSYKRVFNGNQALRVNGSYFYFSSESEAQNSPNRFNQWQQNLQTSIGWEWRITPTKRFMPYGGVDLVYQSEFNKSENFSEFDNSKTRRETTGVGGGPVIGTQFIVSPRIRLSTEASILILQRNQEEEFTSEMFPSGNSSTKNSGIEVSTVFPLAIFLVITL